VENPKDQHLIFCNITETVFVIMKILSMYEYYKLSSKPKQPPISKADRAAAVSFPFFRNLIRHRSPSPVSTPLLNTLTPLLCQ